MIFRSFSNSKWKQLRLYFYLEENYGMNNELSLLEAPQNLFPSFS